MYSAVENNYVMSCSYTKDKKTSFCSDNDPTNNDVWRCDKQKNGTRKCGKTPRESGSNLPTVLGKALNLTKEGALNVTNSPKDFTSKAGNLLEEKNQFTNENGYINSSNTG